MTKVRTEFPRKVREIENTWIPLSDGARLAARIWLPEDAEHLRPVPALLEYIPYRKDDSTAVDSFSIVTGDPLSAECRCDRNYLVARGDWRTRVETTSRLSSDADSFRVTNALEAYEATCVCSPRRGRIPFRATWCDV